MTRQVFIRAIDSKWSCMVFRENKNDMYMLPFTNEEKDSLEYKKLETQWLDGQDIDYPGLKIAE